MRNKFEGSSESLVLDLDFHTNVKKAVGNINVDYGKNLSYRGTVNKWYLKP